MVKVRLEFATLVVHRDGRVNFYRDIELPAVVLDMVIDRVFGDGDDDFCWVEHVSYDMATGIFRAFIEANETLGGESVPLGEVLADGRLRGWTACDREDRVVIA